MDTEESSQKESVPVVEKSESTPEAVDENATQKIPPPIPNGGFWAWAQCAGGFCVFINTWGLLNAFGVFQSYYQTELIPTTSASNISWIGTVQASFIMFGSLYSGPLYDWGYLRTLNIVGGLTLVLGMFMTSLCYEYWQLLLAQGFLMGFGLGCLFTPAAGVIASYFSTRRGLAMGIASSGSAIGGIVYPVIFTGLVDRVGFGWSVRVLAFIILFLCMIAMVTLRMRTQPPAVRRLFDVSALKEPEFTLYALALFIGYVGMFVPYFYIQLFSVEKEIVDGHLVFYLLPIINAAGFFGRIVNGAIADRIGPMNAFGLASGACCVLLFGWIGIVSEAGVLIFCVLYGFFSAGLIALPATVVAVTLCPDMKQFGVRITMQLVPSALGLLIGNPIAGAIIPSGWVGLQVFSAVTVLACTLITGAARVSKVGWSITGKC